MQKKTLIDCVVIYELLTGSNTIVALQNLQSCFKHYIITQEQNVRLITKKSKIKQNFAFK